MSLQKILELLFQVLFLGFGDKLKGFKTIIVNVIVAITGAYEWFTGSGLLTYLCESFNVACDAESSSFYGLVLTIIGVLNSALRIVTTTAVGQPK